jgi:hypothetical protein
MEDLRQTFGKNAPTIYTLMKDPGGPAREAWLTRGVDIIPYSDHPEAQLLLQSLADLPIPAHVAGDAPAMDLGEALSLADDVREADVLTLIVEIVKDRSDSVLRDLSNLIGGRYLSL